MVVCWGGCGVVSCGRLCVVSWVVVLVSWCGCGGELVWFWCGELGGCFSES